MCPPVGLLAFVWMSAVRTDGTYRVCHDRKLLPQRFELTSIAHSGMILVRRSLSKAGTESVDQFQRAVDQQAAHVRILPGMVGP